MPSLKHLKKPKEDLKYANKHIKSFTKYATLYFIMMPIFIVAVEFIVLEIFKEKELKPLLNRKHMHPHDHVHINK